MRSALRASIVVSALALVATAGGAHAANGNAAWTANGPVSVQGNTVTLVGAPGGSSLETAALGRSVNAGDLVTFDYALSGGATCGGGAPRVYVVVDGVAQNTHDGNPNACGQGVASGTGATSGTVSYAITNAGTVAQTFVVFDTGVGSAQISNLTIAGKKVVFGAANGK